LEVVQEDQACLQEGNEGKEDIQAMDKTATGFPA
jgi:hypothetical protein